MSEEEILKECTELAENEHHELGDCWDEEYSSSAIFGLIMLYKQTKKSEEVLANKLQEVNIELDKYKRLAEMNLKDSEEFRENMCEHRCILYNEIEELKSDLFEEKEKNKELETENFNIKQQKIIDKNSIPQQENFYDYYNYIHKDKIEEKIELLKDILKAKEKDGNIYKQIPIEYLKGAIEQLEELLEEK